MKAEKKEFTLSGFTIVRNASILAYPFLESVRSVLPLCDEFIINCGHSSDNTWDLCEALKAESEKIHIFQSSWQQEDQKGGFQLKHQTDAALSKCTSDWVFYIQADEAIHEEDIKIIKESIQEASQIPNVDGVLFDYIHFYGSYDYSIRGRNWYRKEVRAFKNHRGIYSFRDAQGFRKSGERLIVIPSGARVFHYGYVRSPQSLQTKSQEMGKWWGHSGDDSVPELHRHVGLKKFNDSHPKVMRERIKNFPPHFDPRKCQRKWDKNEIKNVIALAWESIFPWRLGEFRNYEILKTK